MKMHKSSFYLFQGVPPTQKLEPFMGWKADWECIYILSHYNCLHFVTTIFFGRVYEFLIFSLNIGFDIWILISLQLWFNSEIQSLLIATFSPFPSIGCERVWREVILFSLFSSKGNIRLMLHLEWQCLLLKISCKIKCIKWAAQKWYSLGLKRVLPSSWHAMLNMTY